MKRTVPKILTLILLMILINAVTYGKSNAPNFEFGDRYYVVNNPPAKTNNTNFVLSIITSIISVGSIFIVWYNVKKQIISVEKNINKQFKLLEINNIRDCIAGLVFEISKKDGGKLEEKEYVSEKHNELEIKLLSYLDKSNSVDEKLINCITKFKSEALLNKDAWIAEILLLENELVINKKQ